MRGWDHHQRANQPPTFIATALLHVCRGARGPIRPRPTVKHCAGAATLHCPRYSTAHWADVLRSCTSAHSVFVVAVLCCARPHALLVHGCVKSIFSTFHGCRICGPVCDVGGGAVVPGASARSSVPSASGPVPGSTIGRAGEASLGRTLSKEVRHIPHTVDGLRKAFDLPFQRLRFVIDK